MLTENEMRAMKDRCRRGLKLGTMSPEDDCLRLLEEVERLRKQLAEVLGRVAERGKVASPEYDAWVREKAAQGLLSYDDWV